MTSGSTPPAPAGQQQRRGDTHAQQLDVRCLQHDVAALYSMTALCRRAGPGTPGAAPCSHARAYHPPTHPPTIRHLALRCSTSVRKGKPRVLGLQRHAAMALMGVYGLYSLWRGLALVPLLLFVSLGGCGCSALPLSRRCSGCAIPRHCLPVWAHPAAITGSRGCSGFAWRPCSLTHGPWPLVRVAECWCNALVPDPQGWGCRCCTQRCAPPT